MSVSLRKTTSLAVPMWSQPDGFRRSSEKAALGTVRIRVYGEVVEVSKWLEPTNRRHAYLSVAQLILDVIVHGRVCFSTIQACSTSGHARTTRIVVGKVLTKMHYALYEHRAL